VTLPSFRTRSAASFSLSLPGLTRQSILFRKAFL
jgi:hypothetical protein